jgi:hypothetical protein
MDSPGPDREEKMLAEALEELKAQPAYRIESDGDEVVVRFRRNGLSDRQITRYLALMELDAIRQKSELTEADALALGKEVNRAVWERARHRLGLAE